MEVTVQNDLEAALRQLRKKLQKEGVLGELKKRRHYEKPSVKEKNKRREAQRRRAKRARRRKVRTR
ncbi:MAG: 30S ribosomal protein S21 [Nitrospirota bacterium]